jgi:S-adenosylmethionine synthetase
MITRNIDVEFLKLKPLEKQSVELVERKGKGHPDSICDGIAEAVSRALCKEYQKRYGKILHHNTDQVELVGGAAEPKFGGGKVLRPMYILISGRATTFIGDEEIPTGEIAIDTAIDHLNKNFKNVNPDHFYIDQKLGQGSAELRAVFDQDDIPKANDTSFGIGFAPLSTTENLVLETEKYIQKLDFKELGEDVKVMGCRYKDKITLTVALATVSKFIPDLDHYKSTIEEVHGKLADFTSKISNGKEVEIHINTADDYDKGVIYLTVTGLSAEMGDDGSVGRGNRANGLITPYRPMSLEASSGKNPVNHIGKMYNLLARKIAKEIAEEGGAEQVHVGLLSQIGKPIDQPLIVTIKIIGENSIESKARKIADYWLENIREITKLCVEGKLDTF